MVTNSGNINQDPIWTIPTSFNTSTAAGLYRGSVPSGLHFMNFPTPMALLPTQQLGPAMGGVSGGGGNDGLGGGEGHFSLFNGVNPYRGVSRVGISESQVNESESNHGGGGGGGRGDDRHDSTSHSHHS